MEEHFKNKLKNHKVDWDKEELLGNIQKELHQSHSNFGSRWLWLLPLLFISTCVGLYVVDYANENVANIIIAKSIDSNKTKFEKTKKEKEIVEQSDYAKNSDKRINQINDKNQISSTDKKTLTTKKVAPSTIIASSIRRTPEYININTSTNKNKLSVIELSLTNSNRTSASTAKSNHIDIAKIESKRILLTDQIPLLKLIPLSYEIAAPTVTHLLDTNNIETIEIPIEIKEANNIYLSIAENAGVVNRNISSASSEREYPLHIQLNEETINSRLLLSSELAIGYKLRSAWSLESGLGYHHIIESFNFVDTLDFEIVNEFYEKAFYFIDQNSDTLFFAGASEVMNERVRKVSHNNHHSYFNIPLKLRYQISAGKANIFSTIGTSYAYAHSFKGREVRLFEEDNREIVDNPSFDIKNRLGFSFDIGLEYPLSQRSYFISRFAYQRSPKLNRDFIDQVYDSYSIGLGIKIFL